MSPRQTRLLNDFEACVQHLPGYENLNKLLSHIPEGRRADYAILGRRILIEQKHTSQRDAAHKREGLEAEFEKITGKTGYDVGKILDEITDLGIDAYRKLRGIVNRHTNFVQKAFSSANSQIGGTISLLQLKWAHGLLVILNEHVNGEVHPKEIEWRVLQELHRLDNVGRRRYPNVWSVLVISHHASHGVLTNAFDVGMRNAAGHIWEPPPIASMIREFYNSPIPNRTGRTLGTISPNLAWPLMVNDYESSK